MQVPLNVEEQLLLPVLALPAAQGQVTAESLTWPRVCHVVLQTMVIVFAGFKLLNQW